MGLSDREVGLAQVFPRQKVAAAVARLAAQGHSLDVISRALGVSWETARNALAHVRAGGAVPEEGALVTPSPSTPDRPEPLYVALAPQVARLRDEGGLAFRRIVRQLGHDASTISRAYDWARRDALLASVAAGRRNARGVATGLGVAVHREIRERLAAGESPPGIAAAVGCSLGTAYLVQQRWRAGG